MDRVALLYGEITAATRAFLAAVAESDRHGDWEVEGFGSCAEWLSWRLGITRNTANEKVRVALALEALPLTSEAMGRGEISFSKARALTRAATPENEEQLLDLARAGSAANLERVVRGWKRLDRDSEGCAEVRRHRQRRFTVYPDDDGMYVVRGRLSAEVGAALMRAVEAAGDALYRDSAQDEETDPPEPGQLRADALGLVAERALAVGFGGDGVPVSGSRAERYQVMVYVDAGELEERAASARDVGGSSRRELEDGTRVTAETARRLACDASVVRIQEDAQGGVLDVDRRTRSVPPALRRALEARDRGCRFPACGLRFTDAHHIVHWADGGETSLRNTVLLCRRHHRAVHEGRVRVHSDVDGRVVFFTPSGRALEGAPPMPTLETSTADPAAAVIRNNRGRGVEPSAWAMAPVYRRDVHIPWGVHAAALEALDPPGEEEAA